MPRAVQQLLQAQRQNGQRHFKQLPTAGDSLWSKRDWKTHGYMARRHNKTRA